MWPPWATAPRAVLGIASLSTTEAVAMAKAAAAAGAQGLMVLPPYVYTSDWPEMKAHVSAVIGATKLSCMLYNNPVAYKTDFLPAQIAELAREHPNLQAVKESSGRCPARDRDASGRRSAAGSTFWSAWTTPWLRASTPAPWAGWRVWLMRFPLESVALFDYASRGDKARAAALYEWFLPLLRLDTVPKFVQIIKWVQAEVGRGAPLVRAPRLMPSGADLAHSQAVLAKALASHPKL